MAYRGYLVCMAYRVHGLRCNCLCIAVIYGLIARNSEAYIEPIYIYMCLKLRTKSHHKMVWRSIAYIERVYIYIGFRVYGIRDSGPNAKRL